ncbi:protein neprosin-like [Vicia villosa]|uniref:protein neprosin-like n=1 Tax=Vicia villosa TaxID=3911 RepID=UPI00273B2A7D|nr:protein neprosin-like [Vicia villosa]
MDLTSPITYLLLHLLVFVSLFYSNNSLETRNPLVNQTFRSEDEIQKLKETIAIQLKQLNKPAVKTIHSPDGDIIDCVLTHLQPAFDHPLLKGQKPLDPPEIPKGDNQKGNFSKGFQLWSLSGESCPDETIPIRRTTEQDLIRASSDSRFGRKFPIGNNYHQHAIQYVQDGVFYGGQANLNVWNPQGDSQDLLSLAQMWVMSGTFGKDLNTIETGWQVDVDLYGDRRTRFFIFWTADAYDKTGCFNLKCPGFVQTNKDIALGATIAHMSTYNGNQYKISLSVWKDVKTGNWWLSYENKTVGYWPSSIFTNLKDVATMVHWGGEIFNQNYPLASSVQMGSGHFPEEGYKRAAHISHINVLNSNRVWVKPTNPQYYADRPNCYNVKGGIDRNLGTYFFYGGPGKNKNCL